ncbi:hypothetical protein BDZ85DRAFT_267889 [Elsinoe ampelina]|uniref:Death domain-containing protein n=1 Tax=Elsinoe ampelina TaxID=302913 RepID=A0A6A6G2T6_9PEZI|nr:hypothetical protein BDZ85DRAFT_267889 [Elsinoe ampelina]
MLLLNTVDSNTSSCNGSPLNIATRIDRLTRLCAMLLSAGADPDHVGPNGTPLYVAIARGHQEMVKLLLEYGADIGVGAMSGSSQRPDRSGRSGSIASPDRLLDANTLSGEASGSATPLQLALTISFDFTPRGHFADDYLTPCLECQKELWTRESSYCLGKGTYIRPSQSCARWVSPSQSSCAEPLPGRDLAISDANFTAATMEDVARLMPDWAEHEKLQWMMPWSPGKLLSEDRRTMGHRSKIVALLLERGADIFQQGPHGSALDLAKRWKPWTAARRLVEEQVDQISIEHLGMLRSRQEVTKNLLRIWRRSRRSLPNFKDGAQTCITVKQAIGKPTWSPSVFRSGENALLTVARKHGI